MSSTRAKSAGPAPANNWSKAVPSSTATSRSEEGRSATVTTRGVHVDRAHTPAHIQFPQTFNICGPFVGRHGRDGWDWIGEMLGEASRDCPIAGTTRQSP